MSDPYQADSHAHLDKSSVETHYHTTDDARLKERLLMVLLSMDGRTARQIAAIIHRHPQTVRKWLRRWNAHGLDGLYDQPYPGRPPKLNRRERSRLIRYVRSAVSSGESLTCRRIANWIDETLDTSISEEAVRRILHEHDVSWRPDGD